MERKFVIPLINYPMVIIFLAFFLAKIFNLISWSWWWVFCPLWIGPAMLICYGIILILIYLIIALIEALWKK